MSPPNKIADGCRNQDSGGKATRTDERRSWRASLVDAVTQTTGTVENVAISAAP